MISWTNIQMFSVALSCRSVMLGPRDLGPTSSGQLIINFVGKNFRYLKRLAIIWWMLEM